MRFLKKIFLIALVLWIACPAVSRAAEPYDYALWDAFLKKYVNERGEVDYRSIAQDPRELELFWAKATTTSEKDILSWPREEALAFWLNVYHLTLIKHVVENYPVTSVQKVASFWDIALFHLGDQRLGQTQYSLNDIRTKKLLGTYRDEKIHLVLSLAAKGGPKLSRDAFTGPKVEGQLFLLTRQFVADPAYVDIKPGRRKIKLSKIFKWYEKDFALDFGTPELRGKFTDGQNAVLSFLVYYLEDEAKGEYLESGKYKIDYPSFDWALNDWKK
jgi:hypothetical protein